jgi:hypothetical protein
MLPSSQGEHACDSPTIQLTLRPRPHKPGHPDEDVVQAPFGQVPVHRVLAQYEPLSDFRTQEWLPGPGHRRGEQRC